jgi:hypothetical protein
MKMSSILYLTLTEKTWKQATNGLSGGRARVAQEAFVACIIVEDWTIDMGPLGAAGDRPRTNPSRKRGVRIFLSG